MTSRKWMAIFIAAAAGSMLAHAGEAEVRATLQRVFPQGNVQTVEKTPVPGVLEAAIDGRIVYVTEDGRYILGGPLLDVAGKRNITEARLDAINAIPFESLPLQWAIKRVKGKGSRRIAIFEDPDCPYCRVLEQTLKGMDDLTVYVLLYPLEKTHPGATEKSKAVWCAQDRLAAWDAVMSTGTVPGGRRDCDNPVAKIVEFASRHRITGTPTSILEDGRRLVGAVPRDELEAQLQEAARLAAMRSQRR